LVSDLDSLQQRVQLRLKGFSNKLKIAGRHADGISLNMAPPTSCPGFSMKAGQRSEEEAIRQGDRPLVARQLLICSSALLLHLFFGVHGALGVTHFVDRRHCI
jgi:hypothetical protein